MCKIPFNLPFLRNAPPPPLVEIFSNGCSIGCGACDGSSRGPIPNSKDPFYKRKFNSCPDGTNSTAVATICDPALRTVNRGVECGAADDWYYYSPVSGALRA
jgi:hypothetical protein